MGDQMSRMEIYMWLIPFLNGKGMVEMYFQLRNDHQLQF